MTRIGIELLQDWFGIRLLRTLSLVSSLVENRSETFNESKPVQDVKYETTGVLKAWYHEEVPV